MNADPTPSGFALNLDPLVEDVDQPPTTEPDGPDAATTDDAPDPRYHRRKRRRRERARAARENRPGA